MADQRRRKAGTSILGFLKKPFVGKGRAVPIAGRSSLLIWPVAIVLFCVAGVLAGFRGWWLLSGVLLLLFLIMLFSRLWAGAAGEHLQLELKQLQGRRGRFPGEEMRFRLTLRNRKFLPLMWSTLFLPLPDTLCVLPTRSQQCRAVEDWEKPTLEQKQYSIEQVGELQLPAALWYGTASVQFSLRALRRGIWSSRDWAIETGDGLGLCQVELPLPAHQTGDYAVYPALQEVDTAPFYHTSWDATTGARGVIEDVTLIRSTRDYVVGDPVRRINWRQVARGAPMTVNVYEEILPRSVYFVFDGESFSGPQKHAAELEEALSILASLICSLSREGLQCGFSICGGRTTAPHSYSCAEAAEVGEEQLLWHLSAYMPKPDARVGDTNQVIRQVPAFQTARLLEGAEDSGRCYYLGYSAETVAVAASVLDALSPAHTELLLWDGSAGYGAFGVRSLQSLKGGGET